MNPLKEHSDVECIFRYWNRMNIIQHRNLTSDMVLAIKRVLKDYEKGDIEQAIFNYDYILNSDEYFFKYKWTLLEFLSRAKRNNIERFLDLEVAKQNFKRTGKLVTETNKYKDGEYQSKAIH
jgi:hypothetical protein